MLAVTMAKPSKIDVGNLIFRQTLGVAGFSAYS